MTSSPPSLQAQARAEITGAGGLASLTQDEYVRIAHQLVERGHSAEQVAHAIAAASCELMAIELATPGHIETSLCTAYMVALRQPEGLRFLSLSTLQTVFQAATAGASEQPKPNDTIH